MPKDRLTYEKARELFHYDPDTGVVTWLAKRARRNLAGTVAGNITTAGYIAIETQGYGYQAHRLIWLWMTGAWPACQIDHIDLDRTNNKWANLREATPAQNCANRRVRADSQLGLKGVGGVKKANRWRASITINGNRTHLGYHDTPEMAHSAYVEASKRLLGDYARD